MCRVLIVAPSLDLEKNVSGVSAVANFIIANNKECEYVHFQQGKSDGESGTFNRLLRLLRNYRAWEKLVNGNVNWNETLKLRNGAELLRNADATKRCRYEKEKSVIGYRLSDSVKVNGYRLKVKENHTSAISPQPSENSQLSTFNFQLSTWDLIHYNFPLDAASIVRDYFFLKAAHKQQKKMVIHVHGGLYLFKEKQPHIIKRMLKEVFSWDNPFIVLSEREKTQIQRLYKTKNVWVLPNCVEVREGTAELDGNDNDNGNGDSGAVRNGAELLRNADATKRCRYETNNGNVNVNGNQESVSETQTSDISHQTSENFQLSTFNFQLSTGDCCHILYLGRIEPNKGMEYLYEAMAECKSEFDFKLHFAGVEQGKNNYIQRFKDLLGDKFIYEGIVAGAEKTELMRKCQVFILPSLYEGLPMSLLETMSFGLVPVVTNVGSIGEYVKDGENGLLLKVKDYASIVKALKQLNNDKEHMQRMGEAARQTIITRLDPNKYVEELNRIYGNL